MTLKDVDKLKEFISDTWILDRIDKLPIVDAVEVVRCKNCIYGYFYVDIQNGIIDSQIECRNPEGLNRDVSVDGYCYASIKRG